MFVSSDLLGDTNSDLEIKMVPEGGLQVAGLTWVTVNSVDGMNQVPAATKLRCSYMGTEYRLLQSFVVVIWVLSTGCYKVSL